ncbi:MAG: valine--tRNA ligase, partial [Candidatus Omnitrophica bacterium]|nr:valine--tRNA ligase [Candidatus Omnitrophota bacterium]
GDTIIRQLKSLGSSCDWPRQRFTMDAQYSHAVRKVFVDLYAKGLIYQGQYIINWCPRCLTALSDEEAEHQETTGALYHIRYPLKNRPGTFVVVATTRPETLLGDTAVAVNPADERYHKLIGETLILPLLNREIKIIADELVDPAFGTGAVKVTPAHDPNDFQMGKRHNLDFINILHPDGIINEKGGAFQGLDRAAARQAVVKALEEKSFLIKVDSYIHAVGHCYRCATVVEPYLSKQWFVRMRPLAQPAIDAVVQGKIKFTPERWTKVYMNWMENIRDWCISRQIWWGHRIPVWYCQECGQVTASLEDLKVCPSCRSANIRQDEDVLDTWFSSWLWPFATLGWPEKNPDLAYFYPTAVLFTAPEIIFFWVARMIMAGLEFQGQIPFSEVYIHGTVRDSQGRKMSKSLGNAIDPLEIIEEYGADALRFSLIVNSGQDLLIAKEKFEIGRNFANKIWNASRLILMNVKQRREDFDLAAEIDPSDLPSRWIVSRFYTTLGSVSEAIERYRYSEAENLIYEFFWGDFCDWYLEIIKDRWADPAVQNVAVTLLENALKMIHPFMPFVTEEIWSQIHPQAPALSSSSWPAPRLDLIWADIETNMKKIIDLVVGIRNVRAQWSIKPALPLDCVFQVSDPAEQSLLKAHFKLLTYLGRLGSAQFDAADSSIKNAAVVFVDRIKCYIPLTGLIDLEQEKKKIQDQILAQEKAAIALQARLLNPQFTAKAPGDVVAKEQERLVMLRAREEELKKLLAVLG